MTIELETVEVSGSPEAMGRAHGEQLRERIARFIEVRFSNMHQYVNDRGVQSTEGILEIARDSLAIHERWDPAGHAEHLAIAEGAGVDATRLYAATMMTDMRDVLLLARPELTADDAPGHDASEGCTSVVIPAPRTRDGHALAGQTWDLNASDMEFVVAVHRKPDEGPESWTVTCAGCLTLVAMNAHGVTMGTTNIKTFGARPGVGYMGVLHKAIRAADAQAASAVVKDAPVAGAHTYWIADADIQLEWESSPQLSFRRDTTDGPLWRTNHCLAPEHQAIQGEASGDSSEARFRRAATHLAEGDFDVAAVRALFSDRSDGVNSISRHHGDDTPTATNAVFIGVPARREVHACRGPAPIGEWITFRFNV